MVIAGKEVHLIRGIDCHARDIAVAYGGRTLLPVEVGRPAGLLAVHHADVTAAAGSQPHGCVPQRGAMSSPARTVCTGLMP